MAIIVEVVFGITKAFDKVLHKGLISKINKVQYLETCVNIKVG